MNITILNKLSNLIVKLQIIKSAYSRQWEKNLCLFEQLLKTEKPKGKLLKLYATSLERNYDFNKCAETINEVLQTESCEVLKGRLCYLTEKHSDSYRSYKNAISNGKLKYFSSYDLERFLNLLKDKKNLWIAYDFIKKNKKTIDKNIKYKTDIQSNLARQILIRATSMEILYGITDYSGKENNTGTWSKLIKDIENLNHEQKTDSTKMIYAEILISEVFYGKINNEELDTKTTENVRKILSLININKKQQLEAFIIESIKFCLKKNNVKPKLKTSLEDVNLKNTNPADLFIMERILNLIGQLSHGYTYRKKACQLIIEKFKTQKKTNYITARDALSASVELNCTISAKRIIMEISKSELSDFQKEKLKYFYNLFFGDINKARNYFQQNYNNEEKRLSLKLNNKTIAIVGPCSGANNAGWEIDQYNYTIRVKQDTPPVPSMHKDFGSKTNFSSYNIADLEALELKNIPIKFKNIEGIFLKKKTKSLSNKNLDQSIIERSIHINNFKQNGIINHIPDIAIYLLSYKIKSIKIFNSNFFLSRQAYSNNYRQEPCLHQIILFGDNLSVSHSYMKTLYSKKRFDLSRDVQEPLNLSTENYLLSIEKIFDNRVFPEAFIE